MASGSSARTGTIDWVDLTTADVESALTFTAFAVLADPQGATFGLMEAVRA